MLVQIGILNQPTTLSASCSKKLAGSYGYAITFYWLNYLILLNRTHKNDSHHWKSVN